MNLQHASEEPDNLRLSPASQERETVEALVDQTSPAPAKLTAPQRISATLRSLKKRNPVKQAADSVLKGEGLEAAQFTTLLQRLRYTSANRWKERMTASWLLGNIPLAEEQVALALPLLGDTVEKSHKQDRLRVFGRFVWRSTASSMVFGLIMGLTDQLILNYIPFLQPSWGDISRWSSLVGGDYIRFWENTLKLIGLNSQNFEGFAGLLFLPIIFTLVASPISLPVSLLLDRNRQNKVRKEAAASLAQLGDVEALPYLLAAIKSAKGELYQELLDAIATLLPRLTEEHYGKLRSDTTPNICYLLENFTGNFQISLLDALGKTGDSRALKTVRRLAEGDAPPQIREAARNIVPILEARREQEKSSQNLLRASKEPVSEKELLRPAQAAQETQPETLLRPSDSP